MPHYTHMMPGKADDACGFRGGFFGVDCPDCQARLILHCKHCEIAVTKCKCHGGVQPPQERHPDKPPRLWTPHG